jgi:protein subunit release factor A
MEQIRGNHMVDLEAIEKDVVIETFRSSGPGGQRRDKVETAVRIRHIPTGIVVVAGEQRSQARNKTVALERLKKRLIALNRRRRPRRPTRVPRWAKRARREEKLRRSRTKQLRQKVDGGKKD